jgi:hypothetical protein
MKPYTLLKLEVERRRKETDIKEEINKRRDMPIPIIEREDNQLNLKNKIGKSNTQLVNIVENDNMIAVDDGMIDCFELI